MIHAQNLIPRNINPLEYYLLLFVINENLIINKFLLNLININNKIIYVTHNYYKQIHINQGTSLTIYFVLRIIITIYSIELNFYS
jgi:hypothetical protein